MTFAALRALHEIVGVALDDIERVYREAAHANDSRVTTPSSASHSITTSLESPLTSASGSYMNQTVTKAVATAAPRPENGSSDQTLSQVPNSSELSYWLEMGAFPQVGKTPQSPIRSAKASSTPASAKWKGPDLILKDPEVRLGIDFPSLDAVHDASSLSEELTSHPEVASAITRIVAACGQMAATVQKPFLTLCDASMGYHLPSCLRFLEATHTIEILRQTNPEEGMHVSQIAERNGTDPIKLAHILRLLATHHLLRETSPNVFAINRISSFMDTHKDPQDLRNRPEKKYEGTNGISAFVGLCTDELFKSSAYLTEAYYLNPATRSSTLPINAPFNFAFGTDKQFFVWLEEGAGPSSNKEDFRSHASSHKRSQNSHGSNSILTTPSTAFVDKRATVSTDGIFGGWGADQMDMKEITSPLLGSLYRLERFGKAMEGNSAWEVPGAILNGFDWSKLAPGSVVVDVGGGIGSTSLVLAKAFDHLKLVIQDRAVVVDMGVHAWRTQCPDLINSGAVEFLVHDFFQPQPILNASVFILRVVLHDWSDSFARRILLRLREAAVLPIGHRSGTTLVIADHILPLACVDNFGHSGIRMKGDDDVEGAECTPAPPPLLANLGKARANAYWMDMTMQVTFNGQERTLREMVALARSAGWKITKITRSEGSLFGHILAIPVAIPIQPRARASSVDAMKSMALDATLTQKSPVLGGIARSGTPTFGSRTQLPIDEVHPRRIPRPRIIGAKKSWALLKKASQLFNTPLVVDHSRKNTLPTPFPLPPDASNRNSFTAAADNRRLKRGASAFDLRRRNHDSNAGKHVS